MRVYTHVCMWFFCLHLRASNRGGQVVSCLLQQCLLRGTVRLQAPGTQHCIAWLSVCEQGFTSVVRIRARANKAAHDVARTCVRQRARSMRVNAYA